jgi:hypothetical protein
LTSRTAQRAQTFSHVLLYECYTYVLHAAQTFGEANRFSASQQIPHILWNPKVNYRIHNCPSAFLNLRQLDQVYTSPSHFLKIHLNINLPSMHRSSKWSFSFRFPHQKPCIRLSSLPYALHSPPISLFSILSPEKYGLISTDH